MLGILLLFLNNHRKLVDTVKNIKYTTKSISKTKEQNGKYFYDIHGNYYDAKTGTRLYRGRDKYNGHRGMIDMNTGRAVEDDIEASVNMITEQYFDTRFKEIKTRLDARKKCLKNGFNDKKTLTYESGNNHYSIYWDNEVKRFIEIAKERRPYQNQARELMRNGCSEEEVYEYLRWKGENIKYPFMIDSDCHKIIWK